MRVECENARMWAWSPNIFVNLSMSSADACMCMHYWMCLLFKCVEETVELQHVFVFRQQHGDLGRLVLRKLVDVLATPTCAQQAAILLKVYIYIYIYMYVYRYISVYMRNTLLNKARIITMYVYLLQIASCINWLLVAADESGAQAALQDLAIGIKLCKSRERGRKPGKNLNVRRSLRGYLLDLLLLSLSLSLSLHMHICRRIYIYGWVRLFPYTCTYIICRSACMRKDEYVRKRASCISCTNV